MSLDVIRGPSARYYEETSEWTLDYPPLFAWFEWALSQVAWYFDPKMLEVTNLRYASFETVLFQRLTVICSDAVLISAAFHISSNLGKRQGLATFFLITCSAGLLLVDHIHFQYNGLLLGMLLWVVALVRDGRDHAAGVVFALLINAKHLFLTLAPLLFVYILRHHCRGSDAICRFAAMGASVLAITVTVLVPFADQLPQLAARLFPFGRGLTHAYWAANAWALYSFADKALAVALPRLGLRPATAAKATARLTGGLVGAAEFAVLPQVSPRTTLVLTLLAMTPCLIAVFRKPQPRSFARAVAYCSLCSFMFGYHVHEKAALHVTVPLAVDAAARGGAGGRRHDAATGAREFVLLSTTAHVALLPLMFTAAEYPIKLAIVALYFVLSIVVLAGVDRRAEQDVMNKGDDTSGESVGAGRQDPSGTARGGTPLLGVGEVAYLSGLVGVELYGSWLHGWLLGGSLPFVPLLLTSTYCAAGVAFCWLRMLLQYCRLAATGGEDSD